MKTVIASIDCMHAGLCMIVLNCVSVCGWVCVRMCEGVCGCVNEWFSEGCVCV